MGGTVHGSLYQAGLYSSVFLAIFGYGALVGVMEAVDEGALGAALGLGVLTLVLLVFLLGATAWGIIGATGLDK